MEQLKFSSAFYIKLGRAGVWEEDAIATGKLRLGWAESTTEDINAANWKVIHRQIRRGLKGKPAGTVSADLNAPNAAAIRSHRAVLADHLAMAIQELHWKDFETLVDLVFRNAGWIRVSVLGQHAKGLDLELLEPIMEDRYIVQVKSRAGRAELISTAKQFSPREYRRVFFVVHSPDSSLTEAAKLPKHVVLVTPERLATMAADAGLTGWIENKVS